MHVSNVNTMYHDHVSVSDFLGHGERATFDAFKLAGKEFFAFNPNPGSEKRILLVTDGNMYPKGNNLVMLVDGLKRRGTDYEISVSFY